MEIDEAAKRWHDECADGVAVSELDFGNVIGVAFKWERDGRLRRIGVPMTREMAAKLLRQLHTVLGCAPLPR
jgi:hypothetical protein